MANARVDRDVEVVMRDGVVLRADVYSPEDSEPVPVIVQRTPYDKSLYIALGTLYAQAGYIAVLQDVRGQFASDGDWMPFVNEGADGYDTIEWAAALPGSDGRVAAVGTSYQAAAAWQAAVLRPPALCAMACAVTPADYYDQWVYPSGAFSLAFNTTWPLRNVANSAARRLPDGGGIADRMTTAYDELHESWYSYLPLNGFPPLSPGDPRVAGYFFDWINDHSTRDEYWRQLSLRGRHHDVDVPVLNVEGWYDVFLAGGIENFLSMRADGGTDAARAGSRLVIGPWGHNDWTDRLGDVEFGPEAPRSFPMMAIEWLDHVVKGVPAPRPAPVAYFSMGDRTWRESQTWPPSEVTPVPLFLGSTGHAGTHDGDGTLSLRPSSPHDTDAFDYDPRDPVPSVGGQSCCYAPQSPVGPYDQRAIEARSDVLVYASTASDDPIRIAGAVTVDLFAASTAIDTDFTAKLVDIHPDGRAINLCGGIVRARHRNSLEEVEPLEPGRLEHYVIDLGDTAHVFEAEHRIGLEISSSNFPMYDRNPNTGDPFGQSAATVVAHQTVFHDADRPSALNLPLCSR